MTIIDALDDVKEFIESKVACKFKLEKPPDDDLIDVEYQTVNPNVFVGWLPPKGYIDTHDIPSIIIMGDSGEEDEDDNVINIRLAIATYDIGQTTKVNNELNTKLNSKGYIDLVNIIEKIKQEINLNRVLEHVTLELPIKWGLYEEQAFPYWYAWVSFKASIPLKTTQFTDNYL